MKFVYLVVLFMVLACGPSEKDKEKLENEIILIKDQMLTLMKESSDLVIDIDAQKIYRSNIEAGEAKLSEIREELKVAAKGTDEAEELERKVEFLISRIATEKEKLQSTDEIKLMKEELGVYEEKYDSLDKLLKKKTLLIKQ